eukprot:gene66812-91492_t
MHGTLKELPGLEARTELTGPVMVIIGDAVAGADFRRSEPLGAELTMAEKVLTANRLTDGIAVWLDASGQWVERLQSAFVARHPEAVEALETAGKQAFASNLVVDVNVIEVEETGGQLRPLRLRERVRAAGPTIAYADGYAYTMYRYDEFDHAFVAARVEQFRDQVTRRLSGELAEDAFKPLRLMNGVYLQLH